MNECDLVLKGGVTSGVVYPHAIVEVARTYRLRNIGGTSAGAIGAAVAAAAEFRRQSSPDGADFTGFEMTAAIANELGADLLGLFQPSPRLAGLFAIAMAALGADRRQRVRRVLSAMLTAFPWHFVVPAVLALALIVPGMLTASWALLLLGILVGLVVLLGGLAFAVARAVLVTLPEHDFGICSGLTQASSQAPALTNWLADKIDLVAGNDPTGAPLTVRQLATAGISIAAVTTDLSSGRPYQLPLKSKHHYFSEAEFKRLFPKRVIKYLVGEQQPLAGATPADLYQLPVGADFPVILVARMSLSFPGLIRAVPLYRFDDQMPRPAGDRAKLQRCLFSDGGISSNFPIHFFDAFLPSRPTFGIMLTDWLADRHGATRIFLPQKWRQSTDLPIARIDSLPAFLGAILQTAREWQDTLQSLLPGYAERIVEVRLDPAHEGGLNLSMDKPTIDRLTEYGREAGIALTTGFDFDEHRWRRAISLLPELEDTLRGFAETLDQPPAGSPAGAFTYAEILTRYEPKSYDNSQTWRDTVLGPFAAAVAAVGAAAEARRDEAIGRTVAGGNVPAVDSHIRLVADTDRAPQHNA